MYDDLVKRLRTMADWVGISFFEESENVRINLSEAADAIDELSKRLSLSPIDSYAGLKRKYIVLKADTGEDVPDCFVLRPAKDKAAVEALRTYAKATDNDLLAADIYRWVGPLPEPPKEE